MFPRLVSIAGYLVGVICFLIAKYVTENVQVVGWRQYWAVLSNETLFVCIPLPVLNSGVQDCTGGNY